MSDEAVVLDLGGLLPAALILPPAPEMKAQGYPPYHVKRYRSPVCARRLEKMPNRKQSPQESGGMRGSEWAALWAI